MGRHYVVAIIAAIIVIVALGITFYVDDTTKVHADGAPPPALAKLVPDAKPKAIPAVAFTDAKGERLSLAAFRGHYVLLNLWATWCGPCVKELPALARLAQALPALRIVAVSEGQDSTAATTAFLKAHGAGALATYRDTDHAFLAAMGAFGLPLSVLIGPGGRERARAIGPAQWGKPDAIAWLKAYIAPPTNSRAR